jgi:hypothetical protein
LDQTITTDQISSQTTSEINLEDVKLGSTVPSNRFTLSPDGSFPQVTILDIIQSTKKRNTLPAFPGTEVKRVIPLDYFVHAGSVKVNETYVIGLFGNCIVDENIVEATVD